jgi:hypothetical protein
MATQDTDFWRRMEAGAPGMVDLGVGLWGNRAGRREAQKELNIAQGPEFMNAMNASQGALARAGSMDPKAAAAERFNAAQGLLRGQDAASEDQLMRSLYQRGMLGAANYNPGVEGITPNGTAMNPQMAAFYAARNARDGRMAFDSLREGEGQIDRMLGRSSGLQNQANNMRGATQGARGALPSKAAGTMNLLKGATGILKDTGVLKDIPGMLRGGADWLGGATGLWGDPLRNLDLSGLSFGFDDMDFF